VKEKPIGITNVQTTIIIIMYNITNANLKENMTTAM